MSVLEARSRRSRFKDAGPGLSGRSSWEFDTWLDPTGKKRAGGGLRALTGSHKKAADRLFASQIATVWPVFPFVRGKPAFNVAMLKALVELPPEPFSVGEDQARARPFGVEDIAQRTTGE
jgi:hypothetical protein